ncbi:uncharacterized protein LOC106643536 isoform X2 [Copidosoma floridanum]|uniref:uncharacterized protein LOC106643536 isoform X2 n=1 Tax=Copidosoma floridanum TaxID=29053 RepID=UPI0006C9DC9A|nr:uncharacterized protein LOC106643536 isoform X2 [Copidosoma floridanum]
MADRNRNFLRDSLSDRPSARSNNHQHHKKQQAAVGTTQNNNTTTTTTTTEANGTPVGPRKEGIYAKKENSNYQRFVEYPTKVKKSPDENGAQDQRVVGARRGPAPLVGWHNGSPTLFPSSPTEESSNAVSPPVAAVPVETPSESSGIGRDDDDDDENTENLSSIADERGVPSTPGLTIDKSLESFSQDMADLSLATGSNPELEHDDEPLAYFQSPSSDRTEERLYATPTRSYLSSPNLTVGISPTDKPANNQQLEGSPDTGATQQGILVKRQYSESETVPSSLVHKRQEEKEEDNERGDRPAPEKDSIDSDAMLEIYDDEEEGQENNEDEDSSDNGEAGVGRGRKKRPKIPDGGWGWVVVVSSLCISMIADGVSFSFGLLYIEFLYEFEESKATTAWIGSLFMAVPLLSGPIMSALVDRYGCRKMTIAGGIISGAGFVLSSFVRSIGVMYLTFGLIAGLGLGLCYVTAVVSIAFWFDKKRTLAVGLGACGTGIGTFVYAPMTTFFIEEYGWRGCVLLLAGTFFNMIVCGTVMRDPEWWIQEQKKQQQSSVVSPKKSQSGGNNHHGSNSGANERSQSSTGPGGDEDFPGVEELRRLMKSGKAPEYLLQSLRTSTETRCAPDGNPAFRSVVNLPTFVRQSEKVPLEVLESLSSNSRVYNVILENYPSLLLCRSASDKKLDESNCDVNKTGVTMSMRLKQAKDKGKKSQSRGGSAHASTKVLAARRMSRKDLEETNPLLALEIAQAIADAERAKSVSRHHLPGHQGGVVRTDSLPWLRRQFSTNTHYFKDIRVHRNSVMYRGAVLNLHKYRLRASSCPNIYRNSMTTLARENEEKWYSELVDLLRGMMDFSMFSELHFLLLSLSTILLFTWFIVPYFYLAEHLTRLGYPESLAANLLSYIGITNTIGMIGLGWAGDQPWMNVTKTYTVCLVACGISTILMPIFTHNYYALVVTCCCFGLFFASNFSFTPVILVEIIPLERFTTAYGLSLLCQGIGNLLGPPIAGWIFDMTGHWDPSFFMAGGWIIVSGLLMGIIPVTKNRKIWGTGPVEIEKDRGDFFA